jgi:hypothetical protein
MEDFRNGRWRSGFELIDNYFSQEGPSHLDTTNDNLVAAGSSNTSDGVVFDHRTQYLY